MVMTTGMKSSNRLIVIEKRNRGSKKNTHDPTLSINGNRKYRKFATHVIEVLNHNSSITIINNEEVACTHTEKSLCNFIGIDALLSMNALKQSNINLLFKDSLSQKSYGPLLLFLGCQHLHSLHLIFLN